MVFGRFFRKKEKPLDGLILSGKIRAVKAALVRGVSRQELDDCLGYATHAGVEMVKLLVEAGADINQRPAGRLPPLHVAAVSGYLDVVSYLVSQGIDVNAHDDDGDTALDAVYSPSIEESMELMMNPAAAFNQPVAFNSHRNAIAQLLISHGGRGGHTIPSRNWGPLKASVDALIRVARQSYPTAGSEELFQLVIGKVNLGFERGTPVEQMSRMRGELEELIQQKISKDMAG